VDFLCVLHARSKRKPPPTDSGKRRLRAIQLTKPCTFIAAVEETGIEVNIYPVSTVMDYNSMSEI
jgi:hypothetical protein